MVFVDVPKIRLNNGREVPVLGLGTWPMENTGAVELIKQAIDLGYRHFDTALIYHSERFIGEAIRNKIEDGTITRDDVFVTSKLWCTYAHPNSVVDACKKTLKNLGLDYVDLYLIHWPFAFKASEGKDQMQDHVPDIQTLLKSEYFPRDSDGHLMMTDDDYVDTWKEMEECVALGLARSIGVSNFNSKQIERVLEIATIKPVTNQVECHPYLNQKDLLDFCRKRDITITCYGPLGVAISPPNTDLPKLLDHPILVKIAGNQNKTTAQVALRYLVQRGTIVIPKTSNPKRLLENISIFDFSLTPEEMIEIDQINCDARIYVIPGTENHKHFPFTIKF